MKNEPPNSRYVPTATIPGAAGVARTRRGETIANPESGGCSSVF
ncbi:hypothetical protein HMPREF9374_2421 [Desmospora sp. 8437]|nr:hypothetical protein HMPREF9374_2421 [Desmospora sp. 8437]